LIIQVGRGYCGSTKELQQDVGKIFGRGWQQPLEKSGLNFEEKLHNFLAHRIKLKRIFSWRRGRRNWARVLRIEHV
jgi:hypothetical protein